MDEIDFEKLTKGQLQEYLKKLGKKTTGNKADLIERLEDNNFIDDSAIEDTAKEDDDYVPQNTTAPLPHQQSEEEEHTDEDDETVSFNKTQ